MIGKSKLPGSPVEAIEQVSGQIDIAGDTTGPLVLQLAWHRLGDETWWISRETILLAQPEVTKRWQFASAELGSAFDSRKDLEVVVFAVQPDRLLPEGAMDYRSMQFASIAISDKKAVKRRPSIPAQFFVTPRVRISRVDNQSFTPGKVHEVGLKSIFSGEFRKPTNSNIRLVISPVNAENYWVMEDEPLVRDSRWVAKADFVSNGFEDETEFSVFAIIIREEIPVGTPITLYRWSEYLKTHISSSSPVVSVTRIEVPPSKNQLALRFLSIDNSSVLPGQEWKVSARSGIRGKLTGRTLRTDEAVWILVSDQYEASRWRAVGRATVTSQRYWELSPQQLGKPGDYVKLISIVAKEEIDALSNKQVEQSLAFSRQISLRLNEAPPMQVTISSIDNRAAKQAEAIDVYQVSSVRGTVTGRPLGKNDRVWILKMRDSERLSWKLVGQAGLKGRHNWEMPPVTLGKDGDRYILMAVVSKSPVTNLTVEEQKDIIAASGRIHIRVVD
ncbi:MAG: hypothetical protein ACRBF0_07870 [Calditrichia bacterium]